MFGFWCAVIAWEQLVACGVNALARNRRLFGFPVGLMGDKRTAEEMESEVTCQRTFSEEKPSDSQTKISSLSSGVHENHDKSSGETKNEDKKNDGIFRKRSLNKCLIPYARRRRKCEQGSDSSDWEVASASFLSRTESRRLRRVSSVLREPLRDNLFDHCFRSHWFLLIFCHLGESLESSTRTPCMLLLDSLHTLGPLRLEPLIRRFVLDIYETEDRPECKDMVQNIPLLVPQVPQQRNGEECGIFVLYYTNLFLENAPENFSISEGYPYFMKEDWFTEEELEGFYKRLESLGTESSDSDE
ncbi:UNVERIFIED_CONTAM: putative ubiquitin-like-specific protease 2B [Sesamum calycinum]|uniref:Ubiquitin-like-specific protease 2B n=1 Tax=Sesamum calycinum TaxID=2727403 RepID=A0AAW2S9S6_9LAMI